MWSPEDYHGREVVVLGLAKSGVAVAKLFHRYGANVTVNDKKERQLCPEAAELEALGICVICGSHPETLIHPGVALLVKNPGIPYTVSPVVQAENLGIEVVTEVEVAYQICKAPMIGITGSNGKTTTTTWVGLMLDAAGKRPIVAGNIGTPLSEAAEQADADNWMVVELSSFQLKGTRSFRPRIALITNFYETHLDYHGSMEDYVESKAKLLANQQDGDIFVVNEDDTVCRSLAARTSGKLLRFSCRQRLESGVYLEPPLGTGSEEEAAGRQIVYRTADGAVTPILPAREVGIPGEFNLENALAATAVALSAGVDPALIGSVLHEFRGVEHRLEFVRESGGIVYYNNSKATNPAATIKALESFEQPIVLLAGGLERHMEYTELLPYFRERVKAVVAFGQTRDKISRVAAEAGLDLIAVVDEQSLQSPAQSFGSASELAAAVLQEAVTRAKAFAEEGDIVLLSPACASWDMFASYEERGRIFKQAVHNL
ncbi:UDP-N-acetylmuramoyl-L-alanine--D-glutamate ligase [Paenibacillus sp. y28]|uniref:UDP-N-acetylmuramoyl-L-alanine--D-glutamate ligase n=1 Tax=Paenibacillus sp. y28 TaxID=3129110 RepID=UPI0030171167